LSSLKVTYFYYVTVLVKPAFVVLVFLLCPWERLSSIVMSTSVSATKHIIFTIFLHVAYIRGSVLLWRHCDLLCTSGFADDIHVFSAMGHIAV